MALLCLLLVAGVIWADLSTALTLEFHLFYFLPLILAAWYVGLTLTLVMSVLGAAVIWFEAWYGGGGLTAVTALNAVTRLVAFAILGSLVYSLRQTHRRLEVSEALRGNLTHMVVHDLKSPLTSASIAVTMLRRSLREIPERSLSSEQQEELLRVVGHSQEELGDLIDELLIIARGETGTEVPLHTGPMDLPDLLREVVRAARPRAQEQGVSLAEHYPADGLTVTADARLIRRVVENLLDNALKFTPRDGQVALSVEQEDAGARVSVRDTGPGIPRHLHKQVFSRFAQASAAPHGPRVSIGLGLAFCRLVVTAHGGDIWVESAPGHGATFSFTLPGRLPQPMTAPNH